MYKRQCFPLLLSFDMPRLSDRAFYILKHEIERQSRASLDPIERFILIARLESLRSREGKPMTQVEIWQEVSDIAPDFDSKALAKAASADTLPILSVSAGAGVAIVLAAAAIGIETAPRGVALDASGLELAVQTAEPAAFRINGSDAGAREISTRKASAFETAKSYGWQAALKGQPPVHSGQQWQEAAQLWQQAIAQLEQVPVQSPEYAAAQAKKTVYQQNLQQIKAHQTAQLATPEPTPMPRFSSPSQDWLALAKRYGWQAAIASQNAPHSPEKWAEISRLWQTALLNLDKIDSAHPQYSEAQPVKARYQKNLSEIRQRYRLEQAARQRVAS